MTTLLIALVKFALLIAVVAIIAILLGTLFAAARNRWKRLQPLPQSVADHNVLDADEARRDLERGQARTQRTIDDRDGPGESADGGDGGGGGGGD